MSRIVTGTAIAAVILVACWLAFRHKARQQRAEDAVNESYEAALGFCCPHCDGNAWRVCNCLGPCGRRYCPAADTALELEVLADDDAFDQAFADLLHEVKGGEDRDL